VPPENDVKITNYVPRLHTSALRSPSTVIDVGGLIIDEDYEQKMVTEENKEQKIVKVITDQNNDEENIEANEEDNVQIITDQNNNEENTETNN